MLTNSTSANLLSYLQWHAKNEPESNAFLYYDKGDWHYLDFAAYYFLILKKANELGQILSKGDVVMSISYNSPDWNFLDAALLKLGCIHLSIFPTFRQEDIQRIIKTHSPKVLFVPNETWLKMYDNSRVNIELMDFLQDNISKIKVDEEIDIDPEQVATIIYTSGTTSDHPRGVAHSHANILRYAQSMMETYKLPAHSIVMSFLPICHGFERSHIYYYHICGFTIAYASGRKTILQNLREVDPVFMTSVPRIVEQIKQEAGDGLREIAPSLRYISNSGAPLNTTSRQYIERQGVEVIESYGMTECLGITSNFPGDKLPGSVGKPLPHVEVKLDEVGRISVKSNTLCKGFYDGNGWHPIEPDAFFRTNDVGRSEGDFLFIEGRAGNLFKLPDGRFMNPEPVEESLKACIYADHIVLVGQNRSFLTAIVHFQNYHNKKGNDKIEHCLSSYNETTFDARMIKNYLVVQEQWTPENGLVTHNGKLRRNKIELYYANQLKQIYERGKAVNF